MDGGSRSDVRDDRGKEGMGEWEKERIEQGKRVDGSRGEPVSLRSSGALSPGLAVLNCLLGPR